MMKRKLFLVLIVCLFGSFVSTAFAANTFKKVGDNPFCRPSLTSEVDLRALIQSRNTDIKTGFAKAGYRNLYRPFSEQFPTAAIDSIKVNPGETFKWMLFRKKGTGPVIVTKNVTWVGAESLDSYRFYIDSKGKRYEFVVLNACGNFALKNITNIPMAKTPATPEKTPAGPAAPVPGTADSGAVVAPAAPMPGTADSGTAVGPAAPVPGTADSGAAVAPAAPMPGTADSGTAVGPAAPVPGTADSGAAVGPAAPVPGTADSGAAASAMSTSTSTFLRNAVVDVGFAQQFDPATYFFVRMGYEFPLVDKLSLMAFLGGYFRIHGYDGDSAFIADVILDYHWLNRLSFGLGAGYWSGNDGQIDLIANLGFLVYGKPDSFNSTLFLEARSEADELGNMRDQGRFGLGLRFRF